MATIYQVAERAGVSLSTVSRVLNGKATVNTAMREKVQNAVQELNYRPSAAARSLASNRSNSIGVFISSCDMPHFNQLLQALDANLRLADKHIIFAGGNQDTAQQSIEFLINKNCDALIIHTDQMSDSELAGLNNRLPTFVVNRQVEGMPYNSLSLNSEQGEFLAATHLIELGHRNIAYIGGPPTNHENSQRLAGYQRALDEAGISRNAALIFTAANNEKGGNDGLLELLSRDVAFSALVCANDRLASGAMGCARELGMDLPEDLSIVGFDNETFSAHLYPPLTTISPSHAPIAQRACEYIITKVYQQQYEEKIAMATEVAPSLIVRGSTCLYKGE